MPDRVAELHRLSDENTNGGSASLPFHFIPTTFNRDTYQLQLSLFVCNTGSTPISLTDHRGRKNFGYGRHKDHFQWQAELQLYYCKFPALCKPCNCPQTATCSCLSYGDLWDKFKQQQLQEGGPYQSRNSCQNGCTCGMHGPTNSQTSVITRRIYATVQIG